MKPNRRDVILKAGKTAQHNMTEQTKQIFQFDGLQKKVRREGGKENVMNFFLN